MNLPASQSHIRTRKVLWIIGSLVFPIIATAILYYQTRHHLFVYFDDVDFIGDRNPIISNGLSWESIKWAFTRYHMANFIPLTWISHMLDYQLFGSNPGCFALHSALIHAANAVLVSILATLIFRSPIAGLIAGSIFAVHPGLVEGVAWISQRKTLLATFFFLLAVISYWTALSNTRWFMAWYFASILATFLSLLSKGMYVTIPLILPVFDLILYHSPSSRNSGFSICRDSDLFRRIAVRMVPYFSIALAVGIMTIVSQSGDGAVRSLDSYSLVYRAQNILASYAQYLRIFFFPVGLSVLYPLETSISLYSIISGALILFICTLGLYSARDRVGFIPLCGFLIFIVTLLPVIGLIQVGNQAYADRYLYGPILGLILLFVALADFGYRKSKGFVRLFLTISLFGWFGWITILGFRQVSCWEDSSSLALASMSSIGKHPTLLNLLATDLIKKEDFVGARFVLEQSANDDTMPDRNMYNLAVVELAIGNFDSAIAHMLQYIRFNPVDDEAKVILALAYRGTGDLQSMAHAIASITDRHSLREDFLIDLKEMERSLRTDSSTETVESDP